MRAFLLILWIVIGVVVTWAVVRATNGFCYPVHAGVYSDWWSEFVCRATATDYSIAFFTYCLVVVGFFTLRSAEQLTRDAERAHVFPDLRPSLNNGQFSIAVVPKNVGRSAAIQREIFATYSAKMPWGLLPYSGGSQLTYDQLIEPGTDSVAMAGFPSQRQELQYYFYGYIGYLDLFRRRHRTYFCVRATPGVALNWNYDTVRNRWLNRFY